MESIYKFVRRFSIQIIVITLVLTVIMGYFALQIDIEAGIKDMLPEDNPVVETFDRVDDTFGGMAYAAILLKDDEILDPETLAKIDEITNRLEEIEGVDDVTSLTNIKNIIGSLMGIEVKEFIDDIPQTAEEINKLRTDLLAEDQYMGKIVTRDFKSTLILASLEDQDHPESTVKKIKELVFKYQGPEEIYITGTPVMVTDATDYMKQDLARLLPFVIGAIILILYISFRSFRGVLLPLSTVLISVIWAVGLQKLMGKSLSLVSTVLPVLLVSVGSAYAIHIVARYYEDLHSGKNREDTVKVTIKHVGIAVIMAGFTTMIGFASLFFSDLTIIQDFALGTALGVGVALLTALLFVPAVLLHLKIPVNLKAAEDRAISSRFFKGLSSLVFQRRPMILLVVFLIIIGSLMVLPRLKPETNYISYFKDTSETRIATELVDVTLGGSQPVEVVIHGNIKNIDLLKRMRDFQEEAEELPHLNNALSMVNIFKEENKALNGDDDSMKVIPTDDKQIAQFLLLLEMSDKELQENFLTFDYETNRIRFSMETLSSTKQGEILQQLQGLVDKHFGNKYQVEITGIPSLANEVTRLVVSGQIKSLLSAILFTFLVTSILLKSIKRGLFTTIPIALTVLVNFGIMGLFGISLDIATVMIASIAVGIGVDYSIHIFTRYLEEKDHTGEEPEEAIKTAIFTVGKANLYNAVAVIAGFAVILFSSFPPLISFGGLTGLTMIISFFGALLVLPVLIMSTVKVISKVRTKNNSL